MKIRNIFIREENIFKSFGIVILFAFLQKLIGIPKAMIFARFLGPEQYGIYSLAIITISIITPLASFGIPSSLGRYIPQYEEKGMLKHFFLKIFKYTFLSSISVSILLIIFSEYLSKIIYNTTNYTHIIIICALIVSLTVGYRNLFSSFSGLRNFKIRSLLEFFFTALLTILGILILVIFNKFAKDLLLVNLVCYLLITAIFGYLLFKHLFRLDFQNEKIVGSGFFHKLFKYSIWYVFTPWVMTLFRYTDRLLLNRFLSLKDVGIYAVIGNFTGLVFMVGLLFNSILLPNLAKDWEKGEKKKVLDKINLCSRVLIIFSLGLAILFVIFKKELISVLYGEKYLLGLTTVNLFIFAYLINLIWSIVAIYSDLIEKTYMHFIPSIIGVFLNFILNSKFIPLWGMKGAITATSISFLIMLLILIALSYIHGLRISFKTIIVLLFPLLLLLNIYLMITFYIMIILLVIMTNIFIDKKEKKIFLDNFYKFKEKFIKNFR